MKRRLLTSVLGLLATGSTGFFCASCGRAVQVRTQHTAVSDGHAAAVVDDSEAEQAAGKQPSPEHQTYLQQAAANRKRAAER